MSCFDTVTTSTDTALNPIPPVNLSAVLESLVALQALTQQTPALALPTVTPPTGIEVYPQLTVPMVTAPLATLSLSSPAMLSPNDSIFFQSSISPIGLGTSQITPSYSGLSGGITPLLTPAIGAGLTAFSPVTSSNVDGSQLSPIASSSLAFSRRQSAPESSLLSPPCLSERRRYSDFTVHSLLKKGGAIPMVEQRKTSTGRKQRTIYGAHQTEVLEEVFSGQNYMVGPEREMLAQRLGLSESQVRVWFQNRRSKKRKRLQMEQSARQQHQMQGEEMSEETQQPSTSE